LKHSGVNKSNSKRQSLATRILTGFARLISNAPTSRCGDTANGSRGSRSPFSKKLENFKAAIALHLAYYNFVKTRGSLRCTPAMEAGIENSTWTVSDLVNAA
jgi:hypothetical protein